MKPAQARKYLETALRALTDPEAYCREQTGGRYDREPNAAQAYAAGAAKYLVQQALEQLKTVRK